MGIEPTTDGSRPSPVLKTGAGTSRSPTPLHGTTIFSIAEFRTRDQLIPKFKAWRNKLPIALFL